MKTKKASKTRKTKTARPRATWRKIGCKTCGAKVNTGCVSIRGDQVGEPRKPHASRILRAK